MTQAQKKQHQEDTIKLLDGAIVLYKRGDLQRKASWQCRLELGGGKRTRKSLKTSNQAVAERLAMDLYTQLKGRVAADLPITSTSFNDFWDTRWLPYVEKNLSQHRYKLHKGAGELYIKPYFANCFLDAINVNKAESYVDWRRDRGTKRPSKKTLTIELGLIRQALDRAARWSLIKPIPKIKMHALASDPNRERRYGFTAEEWLKLAEHMEGWQFEGQHDLHRRQRQIVRCLIWFYYLTGMRPREVQLCKWDHISWTPSNLAKIQIQKQTKTGERLSVSQPNLKPFLNELKKLRSAESDTAEGRKWLFKRGWDPSHTIRNLFKECGLLKGPDEQNRTAYSLRHTYITDRLVNGVAPVDIARNCGTSVVQIQRHYDHVLPDDRIPELTQNRAWDAATIINALRFANSGPAATMSEEEWEKLVLDALAKQDAEKMGA
ncbi:phage integrase family protein [Hephaestia caeni]|uniref:Phage integrase family protein n=1 Tax=Hephaestia caeni TaxID=645617 RepID=A0A397PII2_9SPHN|nr:tyrosine-type recombinase/integrase [Hephaestia caeni]RIA46967.1 phage integrase family protein [Hephaestia caeni]